MDKLDIKQMSIDFNISKKYIISAIQKYNVNHPTNKINLKTIEESILKTIPENLQDRYFYHFTHVKNLDSILKHGFLSTNKKDALGLSHVNIANQSIQHRRHEMDVTCYPNGKVHDYVPFYLTTTNPMLLSLVNNKNIDQPFMIFFAIPIQKVLEDKVVFTNASANTSTPPNFYNDPSNLNELDWDAIDKKSWGCASPEERHNRMAEVLVHEEVPLDWIENIIVWNNSIKQHTIDTYKKYNKTIPTISYEPFNSKFFYFTKFALGRKNETLVTGPTFLKYEFEEVINKIIKNRETQTSFKFSNIREGIDSIEKDFCCIDELAGIYELETTNTTHSNNVSDHTKKVVSKLDNIYFNALSPTDQDIVKISAYFHDIGKGPKSKWKDGKQPSYPDHPADAIPMIERILTEEFKELSNYQIRKICLLVIYHDLIGDIIANNRSEKELIDVLEDENELNMLVSISYADVSSINFLWVLTLDSKLPSLIQKIKEAVI